MRKPIIAGNWKMHKTSTEAQEFIQEFKDKLDSKETAEQVEVVICPSFTAIDTVCGCLKGSIIKVGAQNMYWEEKGAYTGEVSPVMLKDMKVDYVIIGHSERRQYFGETDDTVNKKVKAALKSRLMPIVCVGERLEEREKGITKKIIKKQVLGAFQGIPKEETTKIIAAYEPVWAIGTGMSASHEDAQEVIKYIRELFAEIFDHDTADLIRIQYGGSVKQENIKKLMEQPDIDGALVGGASLKVSEFIGIINNCR